MVTRLLFVHAQSPLHPGTGQSVGAIDLAIARERATGLPYLPGSTLKGVLRDRLRQHQDVVSIFGPTTENASDHAGAVQFADARLLLFPVRSLAGTFAYVTSGYLLQRLARDAREAGLAAFSPLSAVSLDQCLVAPETSLAINDRVVFEDLDFKHEKSQAVKGLAAALAECIRPKDSDWARSLERRLCVVHDDVLSYLVEHATEVTARIRLDEATKTVARGALWYEEALPAETVLVSLMLVTPPAKVKLDPKQAAATVGEALKTLVQLGGNATVGRGLCRLALAGGGA
jgi:CRISPR-associated protein Cmr4